MGIFISINIEKNKLFNKINSYQLRDLETNMDLVLTTNEMTFDYNDKELTAKLELEHIEDDFYIVLAEIFDGSTLVAKCQLQSIDEDAKNGVWSIYTYNHSYEYLLSDDKEEADIFLDALCHELNSVDLTEKVNEIAVAGFELYEACITGIYSESIGFNKFFNENTSEVRVYSFNINTQEDSEYFISFENEENYDDWFESTRGRYKGWELNSNLIEALQKEAMGL